jgi:hypothetical protein
MWPATNETLGESGGGLTKLCSECGLKDIAFRNTAAPASRHTSKTRDTGLHLIDASLQAATVQLRMVLQHPHRRPGGVFLDVNTHDFFG